MADRDKKKFRIDPPVAGDKTTKPTKEDLERFALDAKNDNKSLFNRPLFQEPPRKIEKVEPHKFLFTDSHE